MEYAYDGSGALESIGFNPLNTTHDVTYSFDYTLANQISEKTISNVAYVYDGSGRLDTSYVVNNMNQYVNVFIFISWQNLLGAHAPSVFAVSFFGRKPPILLVAALAGLGGSSVGGV